MFSLFRYDEATGEKQECLGVHPTVKVAAREARDFQQEGTAVLMLCPEGSGYLNRLYSLDLADTPRRGGYRAYRVPCAEPGCSNWRFPSPPSRNQTDVAARTCEAHRRQSPRSVETLIQRNRAGRGQPRQRRRKPAPVA